MNDILNTKININADLRISVIDIKGIIPVDMKNDFINWLKYKSIECGTGYHSDYYAYSDDCNDDVVITFQIDLIKIKDL